MFGNFTNINRDLYANTPDSDLYYYGDDPIVWDRINAERLRRGLSPLPNPRPPDDAETAGAAPSVGAEGTAADREQLRQAEARREQLIGRVSGLETTIYTNQQVLARKQAEISDIQDPATRASLQQQINTLRATIDSEQRRLVPLQTQLTETDQQVASAVSAVFPGLPGVPVPQLPQLSPSLGALDKLKSLPVQNPVSAAQVLKQIPATVSIPGLDKAQTTGLLSSAAALANQAPGTVSATAGIGKFGLSPSQLEQQGFLKPGTVQNFISSSTATVTQKDIDEAARINSEGGDITPEQVANNRQLNTVLSSGTAWTGKSGINGLQSLVSNENVQSVLQQNVLSQSLDQLKGLGVLNGSETAQQLGSVLQTASKFGIDATAQWSKGQAPAALVADMNAIAKDGQFSVALVDTQLPTGGALPFQAQGKVNTVDRQQLDQTFAQLLGNPKIPLPNFSGAGAGSIDADLYSNTKDEDLTYTGDDPIVWDRVNAERLRRGLPGLAELGFPRPPEDPSDRSSPTLTT